jgi:hypothetical protein
MEFVERTDVGAEPIPIARHAATPREERFSVAGVDDEIQ